MCLTISVPYARPSSRDSHSSPLGGSENYVRGNIIKVELTLRTLQMTRWSNILQIKWKDKIDEIQHIWANKTIKLYEKG